MESRYLLASHFWVDKRQTKVDGLVTFMPRPIAVRAQNRHQSAAPARHVYVVGVISRTLAAERDLCGEIRRAKTGWHTSHPPRMGHDRHREPRQFLAQIGAHPTPAALAIL